MRMEGVKFVFIAPMRNPLSVSCGADSRVPHSVSEENEMDDHAKQRWNTFSPKARPIHRLMRE